MSCDTFKEKIKKIIKKKICAPEHKYIKSVMLQDIFRQPKRTFGKWEDERKLEELTGQGKRNTARADEKGADPYYE